jgi:hypothetical protein
LSYSEREHKGVWILPELMLGNNNHLKEVEAGEALTKSEQELLKRKIEHRKHKSPLQDQQVIQGD